MPLFSLVSPPPPKTELERIQWAAKERSRALSLTNDSGRMAWHEEYHNDPPIRILMRNIVSMHDGQFWLSHISWIPFQSYLDVDWNVRHQFYTSARTEFQRALLAYMSSKADAGEAEKKYNIVKAEEVIRQYEASVQLQVEERGLCPVFNVEELDLAQ